MKKSIRIWINTLIGIGLSLILVQSCNKDGKTESLKQVTLPELITSEVQNITQSTAECGGTITNAGGAEINTEGICWSNSPNPSIVDQKTTTSLKSFSFLCEIEQLTSGTTYYIRAFATNSAGTGYGDQVTFTTEYPDITDIDNNNYHIVKIGTQVWMEENLRTTRYNDGSLISNIKDGYDWEEATTGAYCTYNNTSKADSISTFGLLYNWYAVNTGKLAPTGWHVPSEADWNTLINYVGGGGIAGRRLKETGISHWLYPNSGASNDKRFTALPSGGRYAYASEFMGIGGICGFWSISTCPYNNLLATTYFMYYNDSRCDWTYYSKQNGYSVRCIRD
jgi:uncharacterized protein (TIGR02145 family)